MSLDAADTSVRATSNSGGSANSLSIIDRFNRHPFWRRQAAAFGKTLTVPTFDRWLYVQLHALKWMGGDLSWLAQYIRPGMTIVDVGANIGYYSLVFADLTGPSGRVIGFEPDPDLYGVAVENVRRNGKAGTVSLHNCALGAQPAELHLLRGHFNSGDNRLRRPRSVPDAGPGSARAVAVRVVRLDDALAEQKVDLIKIDVQGWECDVFDGMGQTLARNETLKVYFEFWPHGIRQAGRDPREAVAVLRRLGYAIYRRESPEPVTDGDIERYCRKAGRQGFLNLLAYRAKTS